MGGGWAVLVAVIQPAANAGLNDVFGVVGEVAIGEGLCEGDFEVVGREVEDGVLHSVFVAPNVKIDLRV